MRNLAQLGLREKVAYVRLKGGWLAEALKHKLVSKKQESSTVRVIAGEPPPLVRDYLPRPYPGQMVLIRGNDQPARFYRDPYLGWEGLAEEGVYIERVPVERGYVVDEPYVQDTAVKLQAYLEQALTARSTVDAGGVI
jgi:hypothetical protein